MHNLDHLRWPPANLRMCMIQGFWATPKAGRLDPRWVNKTRKKRYNSNNQGLLGFEGGIHLWVVVISCRNSSGRTLLSLNSITSKKTMTMMMTSAESLEEWEVTLILVAWVDKISKYHSLAVGSQSTKIAICLLKVGFTFPAEEVVAKGREIGSKDFSINFSGHSILLVCSTTLRSRTCPRTWTTLTLTNSVSTTARTSEAACQGEGIKECFKEQDLACRLKRTLEWASSSNLCKVGEDKASVEIKWAMKILRHLLGVLWRNQLLGKRQLRDDQRTRAS